MRVRRPPRPNPLPRRVGRRLDAVARGAQRARRRLGAPPPRPRRADLHRPARPLRASSSSSFIRSTAARRSPPPSALRSEHVHQRRRRGRARATRRATSTRTSPTGEIELRVAELERPRRRRDAAVPARRGHRRSTRCCACATARWTCAARRCIEALVAAPRGRAHDARGAQRRGLPGDRDADPHALHARGRARLPRARAHAARVVLRAAAVAAAVQAAADDRAATSATSRSPAASATRTCAPTASRVHPARHGDGLRRGGRRDRGHRARSWTQVFEVGGIDDAGAAVAAPELRRGDAPLRLRPPGHALRPGDRRPLRRAARLGVQGLRVAC